MGFSIDFQHTGAMKTQILAESGIEIDQNTKARPELARERLRETFRLTLVRVWVHVGWLVPSSHFPVT